MKGICEGCVELCICADCVFNPYYAVNTPKPCIMADCEICGNFEMACSFCNQHLSVETLDLLKGAQTP